MADSRIRDSDFPEVVASKAPQVAYLDELHPTATLPAGLEVWDKEQDAGKIVSSPVQNSPNGVVELQSTSKPSRWSKRRLWILAAITILIVIIIVVGATVGVLVGKNKSSTPPEPQESPATEGTESSNEIEESPSATEGFGTSTAFSETLSASDSACYGTICPQVLSIVQDNEVSSIWLFGLGTNKDIMYRKLEEEKWTGEWTSIGGSFMGQPSAMNISPGRVDVYGVDNKTQLMQTKIYRQGHWEVDWSEMPGKSYTAPVTCAPGKSRGKLFTINSEQRIALMEHDNGKWGRDSWIIAQSAYLASSPAVACAEDSMDILAYGGSSKPHHLMVKRMNHTTSIYTTWLHAGGDFRGDPVGARFGSDKTAFLGIGPDKKLHYGEWSDTEPLEDQEFFNLGGEFASVPSLLVTKESRLDVVAVGTDGKLKHNALIDGEWGDDWEDLGGFFNSAPFLMQTSDKKKVVVFGIGPNGTMIHGVWELGDGRAWSKGRWYSDGGNFSSAWFRSGPA